MIERSEVDQMAKYMAVLGGERNDVVAAPRPDTGGGVAEMKTILERFHAAADQVVQEASYDRPLREALLTEATDTGARIGMWEIRVHHNGKSKLYDVMTGHGQILAADLLLYEAARGLVRILNEGGRINSREAIELLRAEQEYGGRVQDMVLYKHRLIQHPNSPRIAVFEARYGDARRRAISARERVCKLSER